MTDAVLMNLNDWSRIALCGQIAGYNAMSLEMGPRLFSQLLIHRTTVCGFIVFDYQAQYGKALRHLAEWVMTGKLKYEETIVEGFNHTVDAFLGRFRGDNLGKQLVKV